MTENMECKIFLFKMPRKTTSSVTYRLKVPIFFTQPEYDGTSFEINSPCFEFADATWCFRCTPQEDTDIEDWIKFFDIYLVRLHFKIRVQTVFSRLILLDADDKEYHCDYDGHVFYEIEGEKYCLYNLDNEEPFYDRRDTLTFIIDLFVSTEMDVQMNRKGSNNDEQEATGIREHIEMYADLLSVSTDRSFKSLSQDFKNVLLNGQDHDLILNVRDMKFQAHRDILRARSEVFSSMLSHNMQEKNSGVINVHDCDPEAFKQLLYYIYTENVEKLDEDNMFSLYYAADKYNLTYLKEACSEVIRRSLSVNNVCNALELANKHCDDDILCSATSYFLSNMDDILLTDSWILFLKEHTYVANELIIKSRAMLKNAKS